MPAISRRISQKSVTAYVRPKAAGSTLFGDTSRENRDVGLPKIDAFLQYLEEAMAEPVDLLRINERGGRLEGVKFPVRMDMSPATS